MTLTISACSSPPPRPPAPVPALATSTDAARAFEELRRHWAGASRAERKQLREQIEGYRQTYVGEQVVRMADLYLAWIALEDGEYDRARELAERAGAPHPGGPRLLSQLVEGVSFARSGDPERALGRLLPLVGQLIDSFARDMLHEEAVIAAITAQKWGDALQLLDIWLRDVPEEDRLVVLDIVKELIKTIPDGPVEESLSKRLSNDEPATRSEALTKALARRLAASAIEQQDAAMARRLLDRQGVLALLGENAAALLELASRVEVSRVNGRKIGVYLAAGALDVEARAAQVSLGAMEALAASGDPSQKLAIRRGAPDDLAPLAALDAEGVSLLVGGTTPESAAALADFADARGIAALLLTPPPGEQPRRWAFSFGPDEQQAAPLLLEALIRQGAQQIVVVGAAPPSVTASPRVFSAIPCSPLPEATQLLRYPVAAWKSHRLDGVLLLGPARCARDVLDELGGSVPRVALGPSASELVQPPPTGASPLRKARASTAFAALGCYPSSTAGDGGYWQKIAKDALKIASSAIQDLPKDQTQEAAEVNQRREFVKATLEAASPSPCMGLLPRKTAAPIPWKITEKVRLRGRRVERICAPYVKKEV